MQSRAVQGIGNEEVKTRRRCCRVGRGYWWQLRAGEEVSDEIGTYLGRCFVAVIWVSLGCKYVWSKTKMRTRGYVGLTGPGCDVDDLVDTF